MAMAQGSVPGKGAGKGRSPKRSPAARPSVVAGTGRVLYARRLRTAAPYKVGSWLGWIWVRWIGVSGGLSAESYRPKVDLRWVPL